MQSEHASGAAVGVAVRRVSFREWYLQFAYRRFRTAARAAAQRNMKVRHSLEQAHLDMLPEVFFAFAWMNTTLVALGVAIIALILTVIAFIQDHSQAAYLLFALMPILAGGMAYVAHAVYPDYRAGERRRLIDKDLPYAVNYIAAMASAGVVPIELMRDLARERTYGEASREIAWLVRDVDLLGLDFVSALQRAIVRSPSLRFQEFLQGAKTSILSGGDLKEYFVAKAEQYMAENRRTQKEFLESLGVLAESYVTVVIAGPLFMLVMLCIMLLVGRTAGSTETFLFVLIFIMLPVAHGTFSWSIRNMSPEA